MAVWVVSGGTDGEFEEQALKEGVVPVKFGEIAEDLIQPGLRCDTTPKRTSQRNALERLVRFSKVGWVKLVTELSKNFAISGFDH